MEFSRIYRSVQNHTYLLLNSAILLWNKLQLLFHYICDTCLENTVVPYLKQYISDQKWYSLVLYHFVTILCSLDQFSRNVQYSCNVCYKIIPLTKHINSQRIYFRPLIPTKGCSVARLQHGKANNLYPKTLSLLRKTSSIKDYIQSCSTSLHNKLAEEVKLYRRNF